MKYMKICIIFVIVTILALMGLIIYLHQVEKNDNQNVNIENIDNTKESILDDNNVDFNLISDNEDTMQVDDSVDKSIKSVTDRKSFYTVEECIKNYINYVVEKEYNSIYALLDHEFINENRITVENISENIEKFENKQVLRIKEMYMQNTDKEGYTKYYVYGKIRDDRSIDEKNEIVEKDYYITVILNDNNMYYTINPSKEYYEKNIKNDDYR